MTSIRQFTKTALFAALAHCGSNEIYDTRSGGRCSADSPGGTYTLNIKKNSGSWEVRLTDNRIRTSQTRLSQGLPAGRCSVSDNGTIAYDMNQGGSRSILWQARNTPAQIIRNSFHPTLDAMNRRLAYVTESSLLRDRRVVVLDLRTSNYLISIPATEAVMSADGNVVAYSQITTAGESIYYHQISTGMMRAVVTGQDDIGQNLPMGLSHDGARLLYFSQGGMGSQAYVYDAVQNRSELVSLGRHGNSVPNAQLSYSSAVISGNGVCVGWVSSSPDFDGDTQGDNHVFIRHLTYRITRRIETMGHGDKLIHGVQYFCNSALVSPVDPASSSEWIGLTDYF